jgi:hypothetical protein
MPGAGVVEGEPGKAVGAAPHGQALAQGGGRSGRAVGGEYLGPQHWHDALIGNAEVLQPASRKTGMELFCRIALLARADGADGGRVRHRLPSGGGLA